MPSRINLHHPAPGVAVSKAATRANWAAAKAESEHGGFFTQPGAAGAVERTGGAKLAEVEIALTDFAGADPTGGADSTAAFQAALDYLVEIIADNLPRLRFGRSVLTLRGRFRLDPQRLDWSAFNAATERNLLIAIDGDVKVASTFDLHQDVHVRGIGGHFQTQWQAGPTAAIWADALLTTPVVEIVKGACSMEWVRVFGGGGTQIQVGSVDDAKNPDRASATARLRHVAANAQLGVAGSEGIRIENTLWLTAQHFVATGSREGRGPSIHVADSVPNAASHNSGILVFEHGVIGDNGVRIDPQYAPADHAGNVALRDITYENGTDAFLTLDTTHAPFRDIEIERCQIADHLARRPVWIEVIGNPARRVRHITFSGLSKSDATLLAGHPVEEVTVLGAAELAGSAAPGESRVFERYPARSVLALGGEVEGADPFRGAEMLPHMVGALNLGVAQDIGDSGWGHTGLTVMPGQPAPDGTPTAYRLAYPEGQGLPDVAGLVLMWRGAALRPGDHLIAGGWFRSAIPGRGLIEYDRGNPALLEVKGGRLAREVGGPYIRLLHSRVRHADAGWLTCAGWDTFVDDAGDYEVAYELRLQAGYAYDVWKPWALLLDGELWSERDAARLAARLANVPRDGAPGVLRLFHHQCSATGRGASTARPSAATVGAGAQWYDTTLGRPIWSDGQVWRDAAGNVA